jgi:hypothetical protein
MWDSAEKVPEDLAEKLRKSVWRTDKLFLKLTHELSPGGRGFLLTAATHTLEPHGRRAYAGPWDHAGPANLCMIRYRQGKAAGYRKLVLDAAGLYLDDEPEVKFALHPATSGQLIYLMVNVYDLTGDRRYLDRADYFAHRAIELFMDEPSPLPKATSKHGHYEAVTGADTLMMAMLRLWAAKKSLGEKLALVYTGR